LPSSRPFLFALHHGSTTAPSSSPVSGPVDKSAPAQIEDDTAGAVTEKVPLDG
jgi:hypothetical protein